MVNEDWRVCQSSTMRKTMKTAIIALNKRGGYSIIPPESKRAIGNFADPSRAFSICAQNNWQPKIEGDSNDGK